MKRFWQIMVCLVGGLVLNTGLSAERGVLLNNPYAPIVTRNVFNLNPPQAQNTTTTPQPPSKITPDGIMTIFGSKQVLFKVAVPPRPPKPATEKSYILSEGQQQDDIEVMRIDEKTGMTTFKNHGIVQDLPLAKAPAITTPTPVVMRRLGAVPTVAARGARGSSSRNLAPFGNRPGRNNNPANNRGNSGQNNSSPSFGGNTSISGQNQPRLSPEEQTIVLAAEKAHAKEQNNPLWKIYPPSPLDKEAGTVNTVNPAPSDGSPAQ